MAEIKWIKIVTDIFDDEKILLIETLPEADSIIVIWFKLLCLAGKQNNNGVFMMNDKIPYTEKMLATIFRRKESTVQLALRTFEEFGMVEIINGVVTIPNWGKHQNFDKIEKNNEYMRNYMREYRSKQKLLTQNGKLCENGLPIKEWSEVLTYFNHECAYCGNKDGLEQEHIVSVNKGGKYELGNIVPACRSCNASKGSKDVQKWYKKSDVFESERLAKIQQYASKFNVNINVKGLRKSNVSALEENRIEENRIEKNNINNKSRAKALDSYVIELPTNKFNTQNENYYVTNEFYHTISELYPNVNVMEELRKIKAWLLTNTQKRKTLQGMEKFINSWLSRQQDNNNTYYNQNNQQNKKYNTPSGKDGSEYAMFD